MRITILTVGSRGDVQPFVALGNGLDAAGHDVTVSTGVNFESFVTEQGLDYHPIQADYQALMESEEGRDIVNGSPITAMKYMSSTIIPMMRDMMEDVWDAAQGTDAIVFHPKVMVGADLSEALDVPAVLATPIPLVSPTGAFPAPGVTTTDMGAWLNRKTYTSLRYATLPFHRAINRWRRDTLGLDGRSLFRDPFALDGEPLPVLYGFSPNVVPPPGDWPETTHATGYWFLDGADDWTPPADLVDFLDDGDTPVYVGFGSMAGRDAERTTRVVFEALRRADRRAVVVTGWGGLQPSDVPDRVYVAESVPHDWLFPRMDAVVHHGGVGTTAEGLRAGTPTIVCPFFGDQPFWGKQVHDLGVGAAPIPQDELTPDKLAGALDAARAPDVVATAERLGEQIRAEDGIARAVDLVDRYCGVAEPVA